MTTQQSILISINTSWNIVNFRASLIRALRQNNYRVITASPPDAYSSRLEEMVDEALALPMDNAGTSPVKDGHLFVRYWNLLRSKKPGVMLTYTIKPNIYGTLAARCFQIPVIANVSGLGTVFLHQHWRMKLAMPLYRLAFHFAAYVFFQNAEDRDLFLSMKLVHPSKTKLLPGSGVDLVYFNPTYNQPHKLEAPIRFVLIARLLLDKGIAEYVAAARMVKQHYPEALFSLVGPKGVANKTSVSEATLKEWEEEGIVNYLGVTDDVRQVLATHDCVVLPSYREGMSRVLLEAAAMAKPLIATDVPGCRQIVTHEVNGYLCQPRDAEDLAKQMISFLKLSDKSRADMGHQSRLQAEAKFDENVVITTYLETINTLIS